MPRKGYSFRDVTETDLPMLRGWLEQPHMRQWWDDPEAEIAAITEHMDSVSVEPLIAELDGRPIGYAQWYDPHLENDHPYGDQPFGTLGIDLSIGEAELLGQGHGSALLRELADELFEEGAPRLVIDPHPDNKRAIRAYEKAGFRHFDTRNSIYGPAWMMALDAPEETD
ncbi:MAG: GNAT family N-acetyltransferase [Mesorhizobium sp.]